MNEVAAWQQLHPLHQVQDLTQVKSRQTIAQEEPEQSVGVLPGLALASVRILVLAVVVKH